MATRNFANLLHRRAFIVGTSLGAAVIAGNEASQHLPIGPVSPATKQFYTSSMHPVPTGELLNKFSRQYKWLILLLGWADPIWQIRNDYPCPSTSSTLTPTDRFPVDSPWLSVDFKTNPLVYCAIVKEYCWKGNANNGFVVQKNTVNP